MLRPMMKLLRLSFLPQSTDFGLLVLRLALGLPMAYLHGWDKLMKFNEMAPKFAILPGVPPTVSLGLAVFAELVCAVLLAVGFLTRFAALNLVVTMGVAFFMAHGGKLSGEGSGEMAYLYLAGFTALLFTGAGKFSADGR